MLVQYKCFGRFAVYYCPYNFLSIPTLHSSPLQNLIFDYFSLDITMYFSELNHLFYLTVFLPSLVKLVPLLLSKIVSLYTILSEYNI